MNKTVELGWINERIQLVAFDGQFIEGAKADRRHMACRFLIDGEGNYKLFAYPAQGNCTLIAGK